MSDYQRDEGGSCLGCSLVICTVLIIIVYLATHFKVVLI